MRILAISDTELPELGSRLTADRLADIDLVISCGDLPARYLTAIADIANKPVAFVPGNYDRSYAAGEVPGCVNLDGRIRDFHGLRVMGLGGSIAYNDGVYGFSEAQMRRRVARMVLLAQATGGIDLLVTHVPPRGAGDLDDLPHQGFACFNMLLDRLRPPLMLHGHIHREYGRIEPELAHPAGTRIVNCCGSTRIEVPEEGIPRRRAPRLLRVERL